MTIGTKNLTLGNFGGDCFKSVTQPYHITDSHFLVACYMVKFKDSWICFTALDARVS